MFRVQGLECAECVAAHWVDSSLIQVAKPATDVQPMHGEVQIAPRGFDSVRIVRNYLQNIYVLLINGTEVGWTATVFMDGMLLCASHAATRVHGRRRGW